jgi:hypothetical protein
MDRAEHLAWCKTRALDYVDRGDLDGAIKSMMSDVQKHDATRNHPGLILGLGMFLLKRLNSAEVRDFITGFN